MNYEAEAMRTNHQDYSKVAERLQDYQTLEILHAVMGMVTEAGELMDAVKKHVLYGKPLDLVNLKEECGDSFWYQALLAKAAGFTFPEAMTVNIAKLKVRYPDTFFEERALNRDLDAERRELER